MSDLELGDRVSHDGREGTLGDAGEGEHEGLVKVEWDDGTYGYGMADELERIEPAVVVDPHPPGLALPPAPAAVPPLADPPIRWAHDMPGQPPRIITPTQVDAPLVDEYAWSNAALFVGPGAACPPVEPEPAGVRLCVLVSALRPTGPAEQGWVAYGRGVEEEHPLRDGAIDAWREALRARAT